tara:strand:+ start:3909 stop:4595 length:687 start_codon:yes stop_codon:yes gene_type:complete
VALIEVQKAKKIYQLGETQIEALRGVDLSIDAGDFVAVWGPSGSGKSTLCHLMGVIDEPTSGTILFDGENVSKLGDNEQSELRNRKIGFVFQSFNLVPVLSSLENVMLPLQMQNLEAGEVRERALEMLDKVGLADFVDHWPKKLSGGQRQRVAIARALVTDPKVVVADEPTANLDSENALLIIELMRKLDRSIGTSFIFSTHDERLLERVDRKVHLQDGLITEDIRLN